MKLSALIKNALHLLEKEGDIEVFTCHGASGVYDECSGPSILVEIVDGTENGPVSDILPIGTRFATIYTGN